MQNSKLFDSDSKILGRLLVQNVLQTGSLEVHILLGQTREVRLEGERGGGGVELAPKLGKNMRQTKKLLDPY